MPVKVYLSPKSAGEQSVSDLWGKYALVTAQHKGLMKKYAELSSKHQKTNVVIKNVIAMCEDQVAMTTSGGPASYGAGVIDMASTIKVILVSKMAQIKGKE